MLEVLGPSFGIRPHHLLLDYEADWFDRPERLEALARYAARVCDAMRAFYARLGLGVMYTQRNDMLEQSGRDFLLPQLERELPDVYWLNFFGPGYVEFWDGRLDGLGVRSIDTRRGGRLIWATDSPFIFNPAAKRVTDYPFKRPFFDRLGMDTFMHETQRPGGVGQLVPGMDVHRRLSA